MKTSRKSLYNIAGVMVALLSLSPVLRAESLWGNAGGQVRSLISDHKAAQAGDILTVVISETVVTKNSQSTSNTKKTSAEASVSSFLYPLEASAIGSLGGKLPSTGFSGSNGFSADGSVSNNQSALGKAAVLVEDVLPNGTLAIKGVRKVSFGGQTQLVVLSGLVRPQDITAANTVTSAQIAEAKVEFIDEGSLSDAAKKGWLTKIFEKLRPY
ncbi:MAG: flagellar basal body L-ring protein FlgH [Verrucomicrobiota bacterium]|nr:flagellar basal body L-ring protein FlgH [Verrucomicrobiota bacterium]